jgi:hypothetical protein
MLEVDDEDVALIAEALDQKAFLAAEITGFGGNLPAPYKGQLKKILQALITAKVQELPVVSANSLEPLSDPEAMKEFGKALDTIQPVEVSIQNLTDTMDHHEFGNSIPWKIVKSVDTEVTVKLRTYQIGLLVNMLRGSV